MSTWESMGILDTEIHVYDKVKNEAFQFTQMSEFLAWANVHFDCHRHTTTTDLAWVNNQLNTMTDCEIIKDIKKWLKANIQDPPNGGTVGSEAVVEDSKYLLRHIEHLQKLPLNLQWDEDSDTGRSDPR